MQFPIKGQLSLCPCICNRKLTRRVLVRLGGVYSAVEHRYELSEAYYSRNKPGVLYTSSQTTAPINGRRVTARTEILRDVQVEAPRRSGRGEERTPGIYCLRMRALSEISRKMGYSRNLPCNEIPLHRIFARTAYAKFYED